jgi:hypothetical protein
LPQRELQPSQLKSYPPALNHLGPDSNAAFRNAAANSTSVFNPYLLGFLPRTYWLPSIMSFGVLVSRFFQRKNNPNCRFPHKLFNALLLVSIDQSLWPLIGVQWVSNRVFKVGKLVFARLLGISSVDGALFHQQGNFPSHGFAELSTSEVAQLRQRMGLADVDGDRVRLMAHVGGLFGRDVSEQTLHQCKWVAE